MNKTNWPDNIRVDGPDLRSVLDLVEAHFRASASPFYGSDAYLVHSGVLDGMGILVDVGVASPLEHAIITSGKFLDAARRYVEHSGTTNLDISAVAGTNGSKVWARVSATQLETTQEDRVLIAAGVETTQPSYTRLVDQLEYTATTGATPAGYGWALVLTINTWTTYMGYTVPNSTTLNFLWFGYGALHLYLSQVREEIAEMKGVSAPSWETAPVQTITQLDSRLDTAESRIAGLTAKVAAHVTVIGGVCALASGKPSHAVSSVTYVSPGIYDVNVTAATVAQANVLEQAIGGDIGPSTIGWVFSFAYTYSGGYLTKVRVTAYPNAGSSGSAEADGFRMIVF